MKLPPPPKWNTATDDIDSNDLLRRARDHDRSLLAVDIDFPRTGQIWQTVQDCDVHVRKWIGGSKVPVFWPDTRLRQGERVRILTLDDPKPLEVRFQPVRYAELHDEIAPDSFQYDLWLRIARPGGILAAFTPEIGFFNELFRLVEDMA